MRLQTTITQTKELDILLPLFYKKEEYGTTYLAVLNEQTFIKLFIGRGDFVSILNCVPDENQSEDIIKAMKEWEAIREQEFLSAYDDAISSISLRPKLNESFVDDLKTIGLTTNNGVTVKP